MKTNIDNIVTALYNAIGHENAWGDIVKMLCDHLDANIGLFVFIGQGQYEQDVYATHQFSDSCAKAYSEHWWQHNIWLQTGIKKNLFKQNAVLLGTDFVSTAELQRTNFYREFLVTMPAAYLLAATMFDSSNTYNTPPMMLNFFRPPGAVPFDKKNVAALRQLYPHIQRAFNLHWEWRSMQEQLVTYHASLDSMDFGVLFINPARRVQYANRMGNVFSNELFGSGIPKAGSLALLLDSAAKGKGGATVLTHSPIMGIAFPVSPPVRNTSGETRATVMLILVDPEKRPDAAAEFVSNAFALSKAESRLIPFLLEGKKPADMAAQLNLKLPTVRSHLSAIFAKTGTSRQQELIRLIGALPSVVEKTSS
ncbi:MAG TPA: helix-turn-helix transcriptional regulator [Burkholderiaceae bacterium]|nr:helix-turn-helix transcriptional regulator [Burkholderiaceae bacterium]